MKAYLILSAVVFLSEEFGLVMSMSDQLLWNVGVALILMGIAVSFVALLLLVLSDVKDGKGKVKGGGVVIVGPVPIVFGSDRQSVKIILVLSIVLVALLLVLTLLSYRVFP